MQKVEQLGLVDRGGGVLVPVKAVPGSSRDRLAGVLGDRLKIAVAAAAEKGKANQAIAELLADALGVPARDVQLVAGPTAPRKEFLIMGITAAEARRRLGAV